MTLGEGLIERLHKRLGERFGVRKRFGEMLDPNMLQLYFRQASSRIQESLNLSQLLSPDKGLVYFSDKSVIKKEKRIKTRPSSGLGSCDKFYLS